MPCCWTDKDISTLKTGLPSTKSTGDAFIIRRNMGVARARPSLETFILSKKRANICINPEFLSSNWFMAIPKRPKDWNYTRKRYKSNNPIIADFVQEEASFTKSQFGNPILVDSEGYTYTQHRVSNVNNATIYWRCVYHYKERGSCPARATTEGFYIKMKSKSHLHKPREPVVKRPHGNTKQARKIKAAQISAAVQEMSQELSKSKSNLSQK